MKIAYAQMNVIPGHPDINTKKILQFMDEAHKQKADLLILPEMAVSGMFLGTTWLEQSFLNDCFEHGEDIIKATKRSFGVIFGNIEHDNNNFFHVIFSAKNKRLCSDTVEKVALSQGENYYLKFRSNKKIYNIACLFDTENFDDDDADFCIKFSSVPFLLGKNILQDKISASCPMIRVSPIGIQNIGKTIYTFDGQCAVFNSHGEIVQLAEPFKECLNFVELEEIDNMPALELPKESEPAQIYRALNYGVKNFLEQIGIKKVVIGVSGGIDSAVASALYTKIVGPENILLVNMPSVFNSATTKGLSEQLAKNLGCKYCVVPIQESVDWTVKQLESTPITFLSDGTNEQIKLSGFVRENIQARDRSARILAALAASLGGVFTCNANKAETTVGYATLYGDEAGFLSALADLWKYQVYALANYMNAEIFGREVIPQGIIDIVPSAELSNAQNVDEGKGDPLKYPYHDYLFRAFVEYNCTPEEILHWYISDELEKNIGCAKGLVEKYFPTPKDFIADLERWWKQFTGIGIAKRIQAPPIMAVTHCSYGSRDEAQNGYYFTRGYYELKKRLLNEQE